MAENKGAHTQQVMLYARAHVSPQTEQIQTFPIEIEQIKRARVLDLFARRTTDGELRGSSWASS